MENSCDTHESCGSCGCDGQGESFEAPLESNNTHEVFRQPHEIKTRATVSTRLLRKDTFGWRLPRSPTGKTLTNLLLQRQIRTPTRPTPSVQQCGNKYLLSRPNRKPGTTLRSSICIWTVVRRPAASHRAYHCRLTNCETVSLRAPHESQITKRPNASVQPPGVNGLKIRTP